MARDRRPAQGQPVPTQAAPPPADRGGALSSDAQSAALTAVIATLTQQIAAQTGALSANTAALVNATRRPGSGGDNRQPPPPRTTGGPDLLGKLGQSLQSFALQIVAPLAPLAILAQTLSTTTSGFGTFLKMTGLVTTMLAGLFLPTMLVLTGVMYALAMRIQGPLLSSIDQAVPQVLALVSAAEGVYDAFNDVAKLAKELGGELDLTKSGFATVNDFLNQFGGSLKELINFITAPTLAGVVGGLKSDRPNMVERIGGNINDMLFDLGVPVPRYQPTPGPAKPLPADWRSAPPDDPNRADPAMRRTGPTRPTPGAGGGGFSGDIFAGMKLALDSMKREVGGPAQMGQDVSGIWRAAVMAGVQADPIQAKMVELMTEQLKVAEKMLVEAQKKEAQYKSRS